MNSPMKSRLFWGTVAVCLFWLSNVTLLYAVDSSGLPKSSDPTAHELAGKILEATGVRGGLIVHVGCGDGELTAALRAGDGYVVHGIDSNATHVARAREHLRELGCYGSVSVDRFDGKRLPYAENLVNLLVAENPADVDVPADEITRVLAPRGVAYIKTDGKWTKTVKPRPDEIDEWTHYLHDASGNAVADDSVVGPPKHFQWIGDPEWLRHHDHMSGFSAMVSTGGRLFYIVDLGPRWSVQMPPKWTLVARDAFSGTTLWDRPIGPWHAHLWSLKKGPAQLMRRLVAKDDAVYVTLGVGEPVTALDAATGDTVRTFQGTEGTEEILLADGVLVTLVNPELDAYRDLPRESVEAVRGSGRNWNWDERPREIKAFDASTGKMSWSKKSRVSPGSLAAAGGRVYYHDGDRVECFGAKSGRPIWHSEPIPRWSPMHVLFATTLVVHEDVVLFAGGEKMDPLRGGRDTMTALSAETGKILWTAPHPPSGYASAEDLFVVDGLVWCGVTTNRHDSGVFTGRDLHTGEVVREFAPDDWPHMPHHRCHRAKATSNYVLTSRTGVEFIDVRREHWDAHHWVRGSCNYGIMPANGLLYAPPHSCACYLLAKLNSFNALAPASESLSSSSASRQLASRSTAEDRLEEGPAYAFANRSLQGQPEPSRDDWPTYRHDASRGGSTDATVPATEKLGLAWQTKLGGKLSSLVMADGKVFVAAVDRHLVHALDAASGKELWRFSTGGRVDSPPTVWQGLVLFGSADGYVYCLRAADGVLAWRFHAAPAQRRIMAMEQIESAWPVHGSVLVRDGVVYCVAGRSMWLDGGMRLVRLDAKSGRKLSETVLDDKYPGTDETLQRDIKWPNLPVALPDVLSCDGRYVYMRSQPFDFEGKRIDVITPRNYTEQKGETAHLFSPTGFLNDSWWHRSYWLYGRSFISGAGGWALASYQAPSGRILAVDDASIYGFGRVPLGFKGTPNLYHLFACDRVPEIVNPNPKQPSRKQGTSTFGRVVPTRLEYHWSEGIPLLGKAMVTTDQTLFVAGPLVVADEFDVYENYGDPEVQARMAEHVATFEGQRGALLMAVSKADGTKLAAYQLDGSPVFDGMIAAAGRLFLSTSDGRVQCLGTGEGRPLEPAPDVSPGPVPSFTAEFAPTGAHPDFQHLAGVKITPADPPGNPPGYRLEPARGKVGLALKKLPTPRTERTVFRLSICSTPGSTSPDKPGNGFFVFGDATDESRLVKCGFRISSRRLFIVQGTLPEGASVSQPVDVDANDAAELEVTVDLDTQTITAVMRGATVKAPLETRLEAVTWVGYCLMGVTSDFSPIEVADP